MTAANKDFIVNTFKKVERVEEVEGVKKVRTFSTSSTSLTSSTQKYFVIRACSKVVISLTMRTADSIIG